jgi:T5SS/PEP-CTERM-associated repeat protein
MQSTVMRFVLASALALVFPVVAWAENNTDYIFNGTTTNFGGALYIPMTSPGTNNSLQIYNGGAVTNAGGAIGANANDHFNYAIVSDPGSIWQINGSYSIGSLGSNNRLTITNGGTVNITGEAYVSSSSGTISTNDIVIVTGSGSLLNVGGRMHPGYAGVGAIVIVTNGGTLKANQTWQGGWPGSSNHTVIVTGANSLYSNVFDYSMGVYSGSGGNRLTISDGGRVVNTIGYVGYAAGGGGNSIIVSDPGSVWSNTGALYVGANGGDNSLIITNGARVYSVGSVIGLNPGANNSTVLVTGSGSRWDSPGNLSAGSQGHNNRLIISDGGLVTSTDGYVGSTGSTNNQLIVTGTNSAWNITSGFHAGYAGVGSRIVITNGGSVSAAYTYLGEFANSSNTSLTVTGPGSSLVNSGALSVGTVANTGGNTITITDGGRIVNSSASVGSVASSPNNIITVAGAGSVWSNTLGVTIGGSSSGNDLKVADGATTYVGGNLSVGSVGSNNRLIITNGGTVNVAQYAYVGSTGSTNNQVVVSDAGSVWNVGLRLHPGYAGTAASLIITNGGVVKAQQTWVGGFTSASNNTVLVTGSGSMISNSLDFSIGVYAGSGGNQITVANGGKVVGATTGVGGDANGGGNNLVTITDSGSVWSNTSTFYVGAGASSGNLVIVQNGGTLRTDAEINVGYYGPNNRVLVTDSGSLLSAGSIAVGVYGRNNTLVISNGARAVAPNLYMGNSTPGASGSNSVIIITGAGSVLSNSVATYVGYTGQSNRFLIANGGRVYSGDAYLGYYHSPGSDWIGGNSVAEITGNGSIWAVAGTLRVGLLSYTNKVVVTDGGTLEANTIVTGGSTVSTVTNRGGVYQFTSASPTITPSSGAGSIMMSNATVSYRGVVGADIHNAQVGNISKSGNNTFQLNNSTNANPTSYKFDSVLNTGNPTNYQRLVLLNNARWISADLTNGVGGAIRGGAGDVVELTRNFIIEQPSNGAGEFDLASSTVLFSGGVAHTNAITGDDFGHSLTLGYADGFTAVNFSYGKLQLGSASDDIYFTSGDGSVSNALYVLNLDLLNDTNNVSRLHAPSTINIYYGVSSLAPANAYLNDLVYNLPGGGLLMPAIPEPSAILLLAMAGCAMMLRRRQ